MITIRDHIEGLVRAALAEAQSQGLLPEGSVEGPLVERPQRAGHGDFASSAPMRLARSMRMSPMVIAEKLVSAMPEDETVGAVSVAPPGFVNIALSPDWLVRQVDAVIRAGACYGNVDAGAGKRVQLEFVSVNPTGPVHVGHARGAVFGSALAEVMAAAGYDVQREYYFNDAGSQMERFNLSLLARYLQQHGREAEVPEDGYVGEYMVDLAREIVDEVGAKYLDAPEDEAAAGLGALGLRRMTAVARDDMRDLRVVYDNWFTERSLYENGQFDRAMALLDEAGLLVQRDGATWFKSSTLGDDEDKVMVRSNGAPTYFATDIAYHYNKLLERRFDRVVDILGADHQGHVRFMSTVPIALGVDRDRLDLIVYQIVAIRRGDSAVRLSKRAGEIVTLRELVEEVGADACRFFFLTRSPQSQMEFDIELATKQSDENPVYYVQYAHARIAGILRTAAERGIDHADGDVSLLTHDAELALVRKMLVLPELVWTMSERLEPHHLPHYAVELSTAFHNFYERCRVVSNQPEELELSRARLRLVEAASTVLARCLALMLMSAPERM